MPKYAIYAGLGGGFGGATFQEIIEVADQNKADEYAYELAVQEVGGYEGMYGLDSFESIQEENPDYGEEDIQEALQEQTDSWADYAAIEIRDDVTEEECDKHDRQGCRRLFGVENDSGI